VFGYGTNTPFTPTTAVLAFVCSGVDPAVPVNGLNTLLVSASSTPVPDVIAISATPTGNGDLVINGTSGSGAFAVATSNVGASGAITASALVPNGVVLPLTLTICQTNPSTGQCLAPPASSATVTINTGDQPTFSVFATASGAIANLDAANRIAVQFTDATGVIRGSTSVAVQTQATTMAAQ